MKILNASYCIENVIDGNKIIESIEKYGRTCYKSESKITSSSSCKFVKMLISKGHHSVLEHEKITVRVICDRGVTHEIVRHRIASYSQESTRYCNYSNKKFGRELTFIRPCFWKESDKEYQLWLRTMKELERVYLIMIDMGAQPQQARSILPNSLKTEIVMTMNLREWRHFFNLRTSESAHPQMREIARPMLEDFKKLIPIVFDDITY